MCRAVSVSDSSSRRLRSSLDWRLLTSKLHRRVTSSSWLKLCFTISANYLQSVFSGNRY